MNAPRCLTWLLRITAVLVAPAAVAVFMPTAWMARAHAALGLGEFPDDALTVYLARGLSGLYALLAGLLWLVSGQVRRYGPVITYLMLAWAAVAVAALVLGYGRMPAWWLLGDAASMVLLAAVVLWLQGRIRP